MNCLRCGAEIIGKNESAQYCSKTCIKSAAKRRAMDRKKAALLAVTQPKPCAVCKTLFKPFGLRTHCCSDACTKIHKNRVRIISRKAWRESDAGKDWIKAHKKPPKPKKQRLCACGCGKAVKWSGSKCADCKQTKSGRKSCSIKVFNCIACGKLSVKSSHGKAKYCSAICRDRAKRSANRNKYRELGRDYEQRIKGTDRGIRRRIHLNISGRVRDALFNRRKSARTFDLLGYSVDELMMHLQSTMMLGMTWENYGKTWNIDHIRPVSWFGTTEKEVRKSWALDNLKARFATTSIAEKHGWIGEIGNFNKRNYFSG